MHSLASQGLAALQPAQERRALVPARTFPQRFLAGAIVVVPDSADAEAASDDTELPPRDGWPVHHSMRTLGSTEKVPGQRTELKNKVSARGTIGVSLRNH